MVDQTFTVKEPFYEYSNADEDGYILLFKHETDYATYLTGEVYDPRGIVAVYQQDDLTRLDLVAHGRIYHRTWRTKYGRNTVLRLARAFLTDKLGLPDAKIDLPCT